MQLRRNRAARPDHYSKFPFYSLCNVMTEVVDKHIYRFPHMKFIGLLLDEHFSWKYHLCQRSEKLSRTYQVLLKIGK